MLYIDFGLPVSLCHCPICIPTFSDAICRQPPLQQDRMNPIETGTQLDHPTYSVVYDEIVGSPISFPSQVCPHSDESEPPSLPTICSPDQWLAELEAWLSKSHAKITCILDLLSHAVCEKQSQSSVPTPSAVTQSVLVAIP